MMKKVKWTCSKFKNIENRVALFGDFRSENHTFCPLFKITLMVGRVGNCHYICFVR